MWKIQKFIFLKNSKNKNLMNPKIPNYEKWKN